MDGYGLNVLVSYINNNLIGLFFVVDNIWLIFRSEKNIWLIFFGQKIYLNNTYKKKW